MIILFYFMNSALVNNQNGADTSLHLGLVGLITSVLTAVILLLVVFGTIRLRRRLCRGAYKTYFFHLFLILHTHFDHILQKRQKKYLLSGRNGNRIEKPTVKDQRGNVSMEISRYITSTDRVTWLGYISSVDAHFVTLLKLLIKKKQLLYFRMSCL